MVGVATHAPPPPAATSTSGTLGNQTNGLSPTREYEEQRDHGGARDGHTGALDHDHRPLTLDKADTHGQQRTTDDTLIIERTPDASVAAWRAAPT